MGAVFGENTLQKVVFGRKRQKIFPNPEEKFISGNVFGKNRWVFIFGGIFGKKKGEAEND